ncbi:MAG: outer membrane protein assembly factor BamA [Treponema sp.]|nr:outer membrane protein assembly factor BamA [Treponema sp.]
MRIFLAIAIILILVFPGFTQESGDWFQGRPIRRIVFEGLVNVRLMDLEGIIQPYISRSFTDDLYWELLGRLYALEYFDDITPSALRADAAGTEVVLQFTVVERPVVTRINFVGNSGVRRSDLMDTITLQVNDVATHLRLRMDEQALIARYLERGFPDVRIRTEIVSTGPLAVTVNFHIDEGDRVSIEAFVFEGNSVFSDRTLERQLSLRTRGIIQDGAFQEARLIADRQAIAEYYHDRGFIDALVVDVAREIRRNDRGQNLMTITFRIYEGRQYTFGGITFEGNHIFSDEQLSALVLSRTGDTVNIRRVQSDLMRIASRYYENGYIFNRIDPIPVRDESAGILSYHIQIVEFGRAHIENIIVRGNERTRDFVILREIPLVPGDVFSQSKVIDALRNLHNLQYFSMVEPQTPPGSVDALMDLVFTVEEMPTVDLNFGLHFSGSSDPDNFPISIQVEWNDRNFLGAGNVLGANLLASIETQSVALNYTQRWLFGLPLSGSFDLTLQHMARRAATQNTAPFFHGNESYAFPDGFNSFDEYEAANRVPPDSYLMPYNQWNLSLGVGSGYRWLTQYGNLGFFGGFRIGMIQNTYDSSLYRPFDPIIRERNNRWTPALSVWTSLSLDRRDIFWDPSSGYYGVQRLSWHGILPFEPEHYIRTDTRVEFFQTLVDIPVFENWNFKAVFGIHSGLSFIFPQPQYGQPRIEETSQLAVDGMFSGRGWNSEFRRKGHALFQNWAEIRIPLAPGIIAWDFFFDAAGIKETPSAFFTDFWADDGTMPGSDTFFMRFSFGGGFRFTISQFPFRFSLARRFIIRDGGVEWVGTGIGGSGFDFVISFTMSTY